jgi:hypothetical protein
LRARASIGKFGKVPAHERRGLDRRLDVVDREHEQLCFARLRRLQQLEPGCVAEVDLVAEAPHEIHLLVVRLERRRRDAAHSQHTRIRSGRSRPKPAMITGLPGPVIVSYSGSRRRSTQRVMKRSCAANANGASSIDIVTAITSSCDVSVVEHAEAGRGRKQHEREFPALSERDRQPLRDVVGRAVDARDRVHHGKLRSHQA